MLQLHDDRFKTIKDEVKDLHPLLHLLLPQLPTIEAVEYTHGGSEMGADFVLRQKDEALGDIQYVGVIAKLDKITQDFTDIERQIDECSLPRLVGNGNQKITLNSIWIITVGSISENAKTKIHFKYSSRSIHFIDRRKLADLISKYIPHFWTDIPIKLGSYLSKLRAQNEETENNLSLLPMKNASFYIEQEILPSREPVYKKTPQSGKKRVPVKLEEELVNNRILFVQGQMGSGKSKLLRHLVAKYTNPTEFLSCKLIPIVTTFKDFVDKYESSVSKLLADKLFDVKPEELGESPQFLVMMDAIDERNVNSDEQLASIEKVVDVLNAAKEVRAIITSRTISAIDESVSISKRAKKYEINNLSIGKVLEFLNALCSHLTVHSRLVEDLKKSPLMKEMPRTPIAAIILARLLNERSEDVPSNMTELYSQYSELALGRWDIDKGLQSLAEYEALGTILTRIAKFFIDNSLSSVSLSEVKGFFSGYLNERNLGIDSKSLFDKMCQRCALTGVDHARGLFYFRHKTFAEFLYAKNWLNETPTLDERAFNSYWVNIHFFFIGLKKDCPELLEAIANIPAETEGKRWMKLMNMPTFLLAGYASPYSSIEQITTQMMINAAKLYTDISTKRIESKIANFPQMKLFWIMQMIIRRAYGYKFFSKAAEHAALTIDQSQEEIPLKAVALFFLSVIRMEVGEKDVFDSLIDQYETQLPLDVQLAIEHETRDVKRSDLVKRLDKKVQRTFETNPKIRATAEKMYDMPIQRPRTALT